MTSAVKEGDRMTVTKAPLWLSARLNLALVGFLGCVVIYSLRTNLSVAIVCMVNQTAIAESAAQEATLFNQTKKVTEEQCLAPNGSVAEKKVNEDGEFIWSKTKQGQLLSAFFWGYPFSQILGGLLAGRFGGKMVLGSTVFGAAVITLLSPIAARTHVYALIVLRALLGFCQGVTFPCLHTMWSHWSPPLERSLLTGMTYAGAQIGNVLTLPVSGLLCKYGFDGGWPSVFYVLGVVALAWVVLWQVLIANSPSSHKRISAREREYIENSLAHEMKKEGTTHVPVPWRSVLTSLPVWAAVVGHFAGDWGAYMMMTSLPTFMNDVLKLDLTSLGFISSIPYIAYFFCINLGGFLADTVRKHNLLNTLNTRRVAMIIALGSQALFLVISGYCSCGQETLVIILLTLGVGLSGFQYAGFIVNYLDIAPAFAGPILGIGNTISCVAGIMSPIIMGFLTPDGTREQWQGVFWLTAGILVFGTGFFVLFASGEVQPWAKMQDDQDAKELKVLRVAADDDDGHSSRVAPKAAPEPDVDAPLV